jgi:hypothetical protein
MLQKVASLAFTHLLHFSIFLVSYIIAFSSYTFFFSGCNAFSPLARIFSFSAKFLYFDVFCHGCKTYLPLVPSLCFYIISVLSALCFLFWGCRLHELFSFCPYFLFLYRFLFNLPRYAIALFFPFFSIANMLNYVDFARRPLVFADFHSKPT